MTTLDFRAPSKDSRPQFDILKDFASKRAQEALSKEQNPSYNIRKIGIPHENPPILEDPENNLQSSNSSFSKMKNILIEDLKISELVTRCLSHPDEEVQFFSFTQDKTLCAECLVSGAFQGHEIANIKKATQRIRRKFEDMFGDLNTRMEAFTQLEKKFDVTKKEVTNLFGAFSKSIEQSFSDLHRKLEEKENEVKSALDLSFKEKLTELGSCESTTMNRKEDLSKIGETLEKCIGNLKSDEELCHYFSKKVHTIRALINDEDFVKIQEFKQLLEVRCLQEQFNLQKFKDGVQLITVEINNIKGIEEILTSKDSIDSKGSILESPKGEPKSIFPTDFNSSSILKSKDYSKLFQSSLSSSISGSPGKFLKNFETSMNTTQESKDPIRITSNALIDKHLKKLFDIKSTIKTSPSPIEIIENNSPPKYHKANNKPNIIDEIFNQPSLAHQFKGANTVTGANRASPAKKEFKKSFGHISEFNLPKKGNSSSRVSLTESVFDKGTPKSSARKDVFRISPTKRAVPQLSISKNKSNKLFINTLTSAKKDFRESLVGSRISVKDTAVSNGSFNKVKSYSSKDIDVLGLLKKQKDTFNKVNLQ